MFYLDLNVQGEMKRSLSVCLFCVDSNMRGELMCLRLSYFDPNMRGEIKFARLSVLDPNMRGNET